MKKISYSIFIIICFLGLALGYIPMKEEDNINEKIEFEFQSSDLGPKTKTEDKNAKQKNQVLNNVILITADDMGIELLSMYENQLQGQGRGFYAYTPTIGSLADEEIKFNRAYAYTTCSGTRAIITTGRYGFRTGVRFAIANMCPEGIQPDEPAIPNCLPTNVRSALIGKWHLSSQVDGIATTDSVVAAGFDFFDGFLRGAIGSYSSWPRVDLITNVETTKTTYITTYLTDAAIDWIAENQDDQFFLWLSHAAPHFPLHRPPVELITNDPGPFDSDLSGNPEYDIPFANAMIEAMDTEMSRLFANIESDVLERTTIIFLGDNGSDDLIADGNPFEVDRVKLTNYEGGIRVPFIISKYGVANPGTFVTPLAHSVDIFATVVDLLGGSNDNCVLNGQIIDSISLVPIVDGSATSIRSAILSELYGIGESCDSNFNSNVNGDAYVELPYKIIRVAYYENEEILYDDSQEQFYNVFADPFEINNLLDPNYTMSFRESNRYEAMKANRDALIATEP